MVAEGIPPLSAQTNLGLEIVRQIETFSAEEPLD